ncbi:MAG TPA: hypothetical protein VGA16_07555 [Candidatus Limnocylindria bacterium]
MRIHRCPRCRAEDISADAHPTRVVDNGRLIPILVCRNCYRAAELELRIACTAADIPYEPMAIRDALRLLSDFYLDRLAEVDDPDLLLEDRERAAAKAPIQAALDGVRRKLSIGVVPDA